MGSERDALSLPRDQRAYWDRAAASKRFGHPFDLERFSRHAPDAVRILDFGCGYGRLCAHLVHQGFEQVVGVDTSQAMIRRGRDEHPDLDLRVLTDGRLPWDAGSFDAVLLFSVLTCIPDRAEQARVLEEIRRVLVPGGLLYASDLLLQGDERNRTRYSEGERRFGTRGVFELPEGVVLVHLDPEGLGALLDGFVEVERVGLDIETMNGNPARAFQWFGHRNE